MIWAQENKCFVPTGSGAVNELASSLTIYPSNELIDPDNPVHLRAAWGCYPFQYSWTVQGTGYSLSKATTNGDLDYTVLTVASGTCGQQADYDPYVTVTVTDSCEGEDSIIIRNSGGTWHYVGTEVANYPSGSSCGSCYSDDGLDQEFSEGTELWIIHYPLHCYRSSYTFNWSGLPYEYPNPPCGDAEQCGSSSGATCYGGGCGSCGNVTPICPAFSYYVWVCN
jgi:hypothetical protein